MADYGLKISKPGYDVKTASDKQLVFSTKFLTPRVHTQGSGTVTHSGGRTVTIAHNLGYVPMFMVHGDVSGVPTVLPSGAYSSLPFSVNYPTASSLKPNQDVLVWADTTNLYIKVEDDFGYSIYDANDAAEEDAGGYYRGWFGYGYDMPTYSTMHGALRFGPIGIIKNTTLYDAKVGIYVATRVGSSNLYTYMWGIAEDNTGDFVGNPLGRPKTSARARPEANPSGGSTMWFGCKDQAQEVINRSGWSTSSHLGLLFRQEDPDGKSPSGNGFYSLHTTNRFLLKVLTTNTLLNYKYTIFKDKVI